MWAKQQLSEYDSTWFGNVRNNPNITPGSWQATLEKVGYKTGDPSIAASSLLPGANGYASLSDQINRTQDPRLLKLPTYVTGQPNPVLTGAGITLPTTVGANGKEMQGPPLPSNIPAAIPQPKGLVGPTMPQVKPPPAAPPEPPTPDIPLPVPTITVAAGGKWGGKQVPI